MLCYLKKDLVAATAVAELPLPGVGSYLPASEQVRYEITDHLGNLRVSFTSTNEALQVVEAHDYYPHGGILPGRTFSGGGASPLRYQGQEFDAEVGLTAFNLRQYDARLGRWQTPDPYGQHHSPYLAMSNNPVSFTDPDGGYDYNSQEYHDQSKREMEEWNRSTKMDEDGNTAASRGAGGYDPTGRARGDLAMMDAFIRKHMTQFVRTETKRVGGGAHFHTDSGNPRYWTKTKTRTYIDWAAVQAEYSTAMAAQHQGTAQSQAHSTTDTVLGHVKTGLDIVSFIPGAGTVTGLLSAGISAYQGDWGGVAEGLVSAVPFGKVVATGAKVASAAFKAIDAAGDARRLAGAVPILANRGQKLLQISPKFALGNSKYGLQHILMKHSFNSGVQNSSKFARGMGHIEIKGLVNEAARSGASWQVAGGSRILNANMGRVIGTDATGNAASWLRVVTDANGRVISSYPIPKP